MRLSKLTSVAVITMVFVLSSCSSSVDRPDKKSIVYQEFLETKILPDGSKIFNFSLVMPKRNKTGEGYQENEASISDTQKRDGDGQRKGGKGNKQGQKKSGDGPRSSESKRGLKIDALQTHFQERLDKLKILKMFCREGYFILDEFVDVKQISIKAECKDGASSDDYTKFTKAS
jgi:hypothetical protein